MQVFIQGALQLLAAVAQPFMQAAVLVIAQVFKQDGNEVQALQVVTFVEQACLHLQISNFAADTMLEARANRIKRIDVLLIIFFFRKIDKPPNHFCSIYRF